MPLAAGPVLDHDQLAEMLRRRSLLACGNRGTVPPAAAQGTICGWTGLKGILRLRRSAHAKPATARERIS